MTVKVGYIDEDASDMGKFHDFADDYTFLDFIDIYPIPDVKEMAEEIIKRHIDILVADYRINEYSTSGKPPVNYTGLILIDEIRKKVRDFPCMLLTSYPEEALEITFDINSVYAKSVPFDGGSKEKNLLAIKIRKSAENYKEKISRAICEIKELTEKEDALTLIEEERLIELDDYLEANVANDYKLPKHVKKTDHIDDIKKLVRDTQAILKRLDK